MKQLFTLLCAIVLLHSLKLEAQWQPSFTGLPSDITSCFVESSGVILVGTSDGVFASADTGNSWALSNSGITPGAVIFKFEKNSVGIFAASGNNIYFSNNNGMSWTYVSNLGYSIWALTALNDTLFAGTDGGGVFRSTDNGLTWNSINSGLFNTTVLSLVVKDSLLFAGTVDNGIFVSYNSGTNWYLTINTGLPVPIAVRSLETDGINLYAGTSDWPNPPITASGMYTSPDNGASWTQVTNGISTTGSVFDIESVGNAVLAASGIAYLSLDQGSIWSNFDSGINPGCYYGTSEFLETDSYVFCGLEVACGGSVYRIDKNIVTSINNNQLQIPLSEFQIYPNPSNSKISFPHNFPSASIQIFNLLGENVYSGKFVNELDVSFLSLGIYAIEVASPQNTHRAKFVKE